MLLDPQNRKSNIPVDNFRRPELTSWLLPSEKQQQQQQNRRPFSEQIDNTRNQRLRTLSDENNQRQVKPIG